MSTFNKILSRAVAQPTIDVLRKDSDAVIPTKAHEDDIGFDLTVIKLDTRISDRIEMYDTGLVVKPPPGFYLEIVPRSSFGKSGYIVANSIGIVDPSYRGTLKLLVIRSDDSVQPFTLPYKGFQLILRKAEGSCIAIREVDTLDATVRGEGGFGSTGQ
jgi:dUTP pyrophosphatase